MKDKLKDNKQELNVMKQKENTLIINNKKNGVFIFTTKRL